MTRKANKTTTRWRRRYLVTSSGTVILVRGRGRKIGGEVQHQAHLQGRWKWLVIGSTPLYETDAQLAALRLQGIPVKKEPRWSTYSS